MTVCLFLPSAKKYYFICLLAATCSAFISYFVLLNVYPIKNFVINPSKTTLHAPATQNNDLELISSKDLFVNSELHTKLLKERVERISKKIQKSRSIILSNSEIDPNYRVHIFYYAWYGNPKFDRQYKHWNHKYLPNWKRDDRKIYPSGQHHPPRDIGSNYYPYLGCYSSRDPKIIDTHMKQMKEAGIGVIVISWTPQNFTDSPHDFLQLIFDSALNHDLKISLHIEPYMGRNPINLFDHLSKFLNQYGEHPALYKMPKPLTQKQVPVFYIYDSYLLPALAWRELLSTKGNLSVRGTNLDAIFLGLLVDMQHRYHIKKSQFDGFYTYFATNGFTYGSTWKNWRSLKKFATQNGLIFIPSVGPGYVDTEVRPWNAGNTRHRRHGQYYDVAWRSAVNNNVQFVSVTSFNEWHEGTQIEPAVPRVRSGSKYLDYEPEGSFFYLNLTKWWVQQFNRTRKIL